MIPFTSMFDDLSLANFGEAFFLSSSPGFVEFETLSVKVLSLTSGVNGKRVWVVRVNVFKHIIYQGCCHPHSIYNSPLLQLIQASIPPVFQLVFCNPER